jgi:hypothetical protein
MDVQFFQTPMGRSFYDSNVPRLVTALERIATALESRPAAPVCYTAVGEGTCEVCGHAYAIGDPILGLHVWNAAERLFEAEVDVIVCSPSCAERRRR